MNQPCSYQTTGGAQDAQSCQSCQQPCQSCQQCPPPYPPPRPPFPPPMPPFPPPMPPYPPAPPVQPGIGQVCPADVECGTNCPCAAGLVAALQLLCDSRFAPLVDYKQFAFFTRDFVLGSSLSCPASTTDPYDNLTGPLDGEFVSITPDSCKNLEVSGQVYYPVPVCAGTTEAPCCTEGPYFDAGEVQLCSLVAVSFNVAETTGVTAAEAFTNLSRLFYQATHAGCRPSPTPPTKPTPCNNSKDDLASRSTASVTAGPLIAGNASVLGEIGDVLILANEASTRFYFVCQSAVGFIG